MSRDLIIEWGRGKRRPSTKAITKTVKAFFGPRGPLVETDSDRIYIAVSKEHWIEVVVTEGVVSVVTRKVDRTTNQTAMVLAKHIAKAHGGTVNDDTVGLIEHHSVDDDGLGPETDDDWL